MKFSQSDQCIIDAVEQGYTADKEGNVYSHTGSLVQGFASGKGRHLKVCFYYRCSGKKTTFLKHRFIYYFFHREEMFNHRLVRHLDDNPNNNALSNLKAGTYKENRADIPREKLSANAKRNSYLLVERQRKLTDGEIRQMREYRLSTGESYAKIAKRFNISTMTAFRAVTKQSWKEL